MGGDTSACARGPTHARTPVTGAAAHVNLIDDPSQPPRPSTHDARADVRVGLRGGAHNAALCAPPSGESGLQRTSRRAAARRKPATRGALDITEGYVSSHVGPRSGNVPTPHAASRSNLGCSVRPGRAEGSVAPSCSPRLGACSSRGEQRETGACGRPCGQPRGCSPRLRAPSGACGKRLRKRFWRQNGRAAADRRGPSLFRCSRWRVRAVDDAARDVRGGYVDDD